VGAILYVTSEVTHLDAYYSGTSSSIVQVSPGTKYKFTYFAASVLFMLSGLMDVYVYWKHPLLPLLCSAIVFAASFGIVSALLVDNNYHLSNVFNNVGAHFWVLDALGDVYMALYPLPDEDDGDDDDSSSSSGCFSFLDDAKKFCGSEGCNFLARYARCIELTGALAFVVGTTMDLVVSYFYIFQNENEQLAISSLVISMFWLFAGICYLVVGLV
jgi:hypothetical protein